MNYEGKYKEVLKRLKEAFAPVNGCEISGLTRSCIEEIFPELAESEDERISREITEFLVDFNNGEYEIPNENTIDSWLSWLEKQGEQKITNSKEDIDFTIYYPLKNGNGKYECIPYSFYGSLTSFSDNEDLIDFLRNCFYTKQKCEDWIKKQDEQKPSWSEEDEKNLNTIIKVIHGGTHLAYENEIDWLKSLRPQNKWKPSDEQMEVIKELTDDNEQRYFYPTLKLLYNDLEKLKENKL